MKDVAIIITIITISYVLVSFTGTTDIAEECSKHGIFYITNCI